MDGLIEIEWAQIEYEMFQVRQPTYKIPENDENIIELMESIKERGIIEPIVVKKLNSGKYGVICGHRRLEALRRLTSKEKDTHQTIYEALRNKKIPVRVIDVPDEDVPLISLVENIHRKGMIWQEEAKAFIKHMEKTGTSERELAKKIGKSHRYVQERVSNYKTLSEEDKENPKLRLRTLKESPKKNEEVPEQNIEESRDTILNYLKGNFMHIYENFRNYEKSGLDVNEWAVRKNLRRLGLRRDECDIIIRELGNNSQIVRSDKRVEDFLNYLGNYVRAKKFLVIRVNDQVLDRLRKVAKYKGKSTFETLSEILQDGIYPCLSRIDELRKEVEQMLEREEKEASG